MLNLIKDGKANTVIVLRDEPNGVQIEAAKILADHFRQISGADIKVISIEDLEGPQIKDNVIIPDEGVIDVENFIFIGDGDLARFNLDIDVNKVGYGGFIIKTFPNSIVFAGRDNNDPGQFVTSDNRLTPYSRGTLYAVTYFLEEYLGVKYLWPGEVGKVVPLKTSISIPEIDYSYTPKLKQRQMRIVLFNDRIQKGLDWLHITKRDYYNLRRSAQQTISESSNWRAWQHLGGTLGITGGDGFVLPKKCWEEWPEQHPEWFAMQLDGDRSQMVKGRLSERPRLCLSNPDLLDAIAEVKIKELKAHPEQRSVSVEVHDGGYTGFCMCDKCKALDVKSARKYKIGSWDHKKNKIVYFEYPAMTDRMVYFYNEIAKRVTKVFPDVLFGGIQYSCYSSAPVKRKLHPNVVIRFVGEWYNKEVEREMTIADWTEWSKMASKIYYRPNILCQGYHQGFPLMNFTHKFAKDFKFMADNSMLGTEFDSIFEMWSTQGLIYYVVAKLNWNPDQNVDDIIDDYCRSGFGKGWKYIRKYWDYVEEITTENAVNEKMHMLDRFTPKTILELAGYLDAAEKADSDKKVRARIEFLRDGLIFTDLQAKAFRINNKLKTDRNNEKLKIAGQKILDEKWLYMRKLFMKNPLAINVGNSVFYNRRCFSYLGKRNLPSPEVVKKADAIKYQPRSENIKILEADEKGQLVNP